MSFLWYDLETFGFDPRRSRIAQFAALRTDDDLQPIGEPVTCFCQPADDLLPSPQAALITGITPQQAQRDGVRESEFIGLLLEEMGVPQTCSVGFNSLRFDDEHVRLAAWRNFHDPYEREWKNGNSRWDLLDVLRLAYALSPRGIEWPQREDGAASFKLTDLSAANGIGHEHAHEALADVRATLALARRMRDAQPRLYAYALRLRDKRFAASLCDVATMAPVLHVSGRYPASRRHAAVVAPICRHPSYDNRIIAFDLDAAPDALLTLAAGDIADRVFTAAADLPEGVDRIPLKQIHLNRCPMLVSYPTLRPRELERLRIDPAQVERHARALRGADGLAEKVRQVFSAPPSTATGDADAAIYEGFVDAADRRLLPQIRAAAPAHLPRFSDGLRDQRLREMLFRYQARNWPESLDPAQRAHWDEWRRHRLEDGSGLSEYSFASHAAEVAALRQTHAGDGAAQTLLDAMDDWRRNLRASLP